MLDPKDPLYKKLNPNTFTIQERIDEAYAFLRELRVPGEVQGEEQREEQREGQREVQMQVESMAQHLLETHPFSVLDLRTN